MTRIVRVIGLAVVLAVTWRAGIAAAAGKFVVGYAAMNARLAPLWLAEEQGYFAKYGMESQAVFLRSATLLVTGLSSGDIQAGSGGGSAALSAVASGYDVKIIGSFSTRNSYDLVARPSIKRAEDLRVRKSGSPASAVDRGWEPCFGLSNWDWTPSAIKLRCWPLVIRQCKPKPLRTESSMRRRWTACLAGG